MDSRSPLAEIKQTTRLALDERSLSSLSELECVDILANVQSLLKACKSQEADSKAKTEAIKMLWVKQKTLSKTRRDVGQLEKDLLKEKIGLLDASIRETKCKQELEQVEKELEIGAQQLEQLEALKSKLSQELQEVDKILAGHPDANNLWVNVVSGFLVFCMLVLVPLLMSSVSVHMFDSLINAVN